MGILATYLKMKPLVREDYVDAPSECCTCFKNAPCSYCMSLTEEEADAQWNGTTLKAIWCDEVTEYTDTRDPGLYDPPKGDRYPGKVNCTDNVSQWIGKECFDREFFYSDRAFRNQYEPERIVVGNNWYKADKYQPEFYPRPDPKVPMGSRDPQYDFMEIELGTEPPRFGTFRDFESESIGMISMGNGPFMVSNELLRHEKAQRFFAQYCNRLRDDYRTDSVIFAWKAWTYFECEEDPRMNITVNSEPYRTGLLGYYNLQAKDAYHVALNDIQDSSSVHRKTYTPPSQT